MLLRWIIRSVFGSSFKRAAWNAVTQRSTEEPASPAPSPPTNDETDVTTIEVVICFENARVADAMLDRLKNKTETKAAGFTVVTGTASGSPVAIAWPDSSSNLAPMCDALATAYSPQLFISASFGVALNQSLSVGQIILANSIASKQKQRLTIPLPNQHLGQCTVGPVVSEFKIPKSPDSRLELGKRSKALVTDRISYTIAAACKPLNAPVLSLIAVTTTVNDQSTTLIKKSKKKEHVARRVGSILGTVWQKPTSITDTWHIEEAAIKASSSIARFICEKILA